MIIRSRPKYIKPDFFDNCANTVVDNGSMYFNSGRSALLFYLQFLFRERGGLVVALQSFNCHVVLDAVIQAGHKPLLLDVELVSYSIPVENVQAVQDMIDVVIVTHYQGIPCRDYLPITELCRKKNIIIIEDQAQTYGSSIDGVEVGTLGDASINSFAFDKPFSSMYGGMLSLAESNCNDCKISEDYNLLSQEPVSTGELHLKMLRFMMMYTTPENYHQGLNYYDDLESRIRNNSNLLDVYIEMTSRKPWMRVISSIKSALKLLFSYNQIEPARLAISKIRMIELQKKEFKYNSDIAAALDNYFEKMDGVKTVRLRNAHICWNRYSIVDTSNKVTSLLKELGVEAGPYNWNKSLTIDGKRHKNSHYLSKRIVNIPVWSQELIKVLS